MKISMYGLNFQIFEATSAEELMKLVSKFFQETETEFIEVPDDEICFLDTDEYVSTNNITKNQIENKNLLIPKIYKFEMRRLPKNSINCATSVTSPRTFFNANIPSEKYLPGKSWDELYEPPDDMGDEKESEDLKYNYYAYILYK